MSTKKIKVNKPKAVISDIDVSSTIKEPLRPNCFGYFNKCPYDGVCPTPDIKSNCEKETRRKNNEIKKENREYKKAVKTEKIKHNIHSIKVFIYNLFKIVTWVKFIQSFDQLFTVIFINLMMFILFACMLFAIYFIYKANWRMSLTSAVVFLAVGYIIEKMDQGGSKIGNEGE